MNPKEPFLCGAPILILDRFFSEENRPLILFAIFMRTEAYACVIVRNIDGKLVEWSVLRAEIRN